MEIIGEPSTSHKNDEFRGFQAVRLHLQTHVFYLFPEFQDYASVRLPKNGTPRIQCTTCIYLFTVTGVIHPLLPTIQVMTHINMFVKFTMCFCG